MAIYKDGLLGPVSGKSGALVGANWRSINYLRSLPVTKKKPATEKQLAARLKFTMAAEFLSPIRDFIRVLPRGKAIARKTDFNEATSIILKTIKGEYPTFTISFEDAVFTRGSLMGVLPNLEAIDDVGIKVSWSTRLGRGASYNDQVYILLYNSDCDDSFAFGGTNRNAGERLVPLELIGVGIFHVWSFVYSSDGLECSNSRYLGSIELKETEVPEQEIPGLKPVKRKHKKVESKPAESTGENPAIDLHPADTPDISIDADS